MQYWQDVSHIAHYHKRKTSPSYTRCSENHNNRCAENRKIRGLKFELCTGAIWRRIEKFEYLCTTTYHPL